jgi:hypothetical protein
MGVDLGHVGSSPNRAMSTGSHAWVAILVGNGTFGGTSTLSPKRQSESDRQYIRPKAFETQPPRQPRPTRQEQLAFLPADRHD